MLEWNFLMPFIIDDNNKTVKIKLASRDKGMRRLLTSGLYQEQLMHQNKFGTCLMHN